EASHIRRRLKANNTGIIYSVDIKSYINSHRHHRDRHSFPTRRSSDLPTTASPWPSFCRAKSGPSPISCIRPRWTRRACWPPCARSEEHTSELQSRGHLVCRLLLEKKNTQNPRRVKANLTGNKSRVRLT